MEREKEGPRTGPADASICKTQVLTEGGLALLGSATNAFVAAPQEVRFVRKVEVDVPRNQSLVPKWILYK